MHDLLGEKREGRAMVGGPRRRRGLIFLLAALSALLLAGCKQQEAPKQETVAREAVTVCCHSTALLPLVVAEKQGFFSAQGLTVTARDFNVGRDALEAMFRGECDLATAAEPPVVEYAQKRDDFRILSALQSSDNHQRLVARADRGVTQPADLRGKRIATVRGTGFHYFLELFLQKHGIKAGELTILFMKSNELLVALTSGQVDAIAINNKVIAQAQQALGDKAVVMEAPGLCYNYMMILATTALLDKRPGLAERFLRALAQAEDFIRQRPEEVQALAQNSQRISPAEIKQLLDSYSYQLALDHALLMGLEETARWMRQQSGGSQCPVSNYLNLIAAEPLRAVRPEGVRLEK